MANTVELNASLNGSSCTPWTRSTRRAYIHTWTGQSDKQSCQRDFLSNCTVLISIQETRKFTDLLFVGSLYSANIIIVTKTFLYFPSGYEVTLTGYKGVWIRTNQAILFRLCYRNRRFSYVHNVICDKSYLEMSVL